MKIIDVFPYFNERELLQLRLELLKDSVDYFIITEGNLTHTGEPKEYTCEQVIDEIGFPKDKVKILKVDLPTKQEVADNWARENLQRNAAANIFPKDAVGIISDLDEIIDPNFIKYYVEIARNNPNYILRIPMYYLNSTPDLQIDCKNDTAVWTAGFLCLPHHMEKYSLSKIRESRTRGFNNIVFKDIFAVDNGEVEMAGWHFTWMGTNQNRLKKFNSIADHYVFKNKTNAINHNISIFKPAEGSTDPLHREDHKLTRFPIHKLPSKIFELPNVRKFLFPDQMQHFCYDSIFGENWFTFPNLYSNMVRRFGNGAKFAEVGVWKGRSAAFMCVEIINSGKQITNYCIDTWEGSSEHQEANKHELKDLYDIFQRNMLPVKDYYVPMKMTSLEAATKFENESLDFVFIDASHEYEHVKEDLLAWAPKVKRGGVLAGHDCYPHNPEFGGVFKAVTELYGTNFDISENCFIIEKS